MPTFQQKYAHLTTLISTLLLLLFPATSREAKRQDSAGVLAPIVGRVEAQPLLAQVRRLREALEFLGEPLPLSTLRLLAVAETEPDETKVGRLVQQALDPLCFAALTIPSGQPLKVAANPRSPTLVQQGWRICLLKVVNEAETEGQIRLRSPNAGRMANAPKNEVKSRWLEIEPYTARPLSPNLSGLPLEYRIIQLYSRDAGDLKATISFSAGTGQAAPTVRRWDFNQALEKWEGAPMKISSGAVELTGPDMFVSTPVQISAGEMRVRMRLRVDRETTPELFWGTNENDIDWERNHIVLPKIPANAWQEVSADLRSEGDLTTFACYLGAKPSRVAIDWIEVSSRANGTSTQADFAFHAKPSHKVTFRVRDENGKPCTASFLIRDTQGRVYPAQGKRLAPDFHFHPQIYRANGENVLLPAGNYTIECRRGPESIPERKPLTVGGKSASFSYQVRRWIDPTQRGWWSGDHHIHAAGCAHYTSPTEGVLPQDMQRHILGEDLKVGANLTWGPCFDYQKQFFTGKEDRVSQYPYLLRYDIEVSGFGSHNSGHLCLLRLKDQMYPGGKSKDHWPTLGLNTLKWAKAQDAVCGPAHSANGLTNMTSQRVSGPDGPNGLPTLQIPAFDGIGANEFIVDVTHEVPGPDGKPVPAVDFLSSMDTDRKAELNIWYHVLNSGFRTRLSGETDFPCISGDRVGMGRVYVKQKNRLAYDDWCQGIREGRSYVSDGLHHLLDFAARPLVGGSLVSVGENGSELRLAAPGKIILTALAAARPADGKEITVEAIVNGYPVAQQTIPGDGAQHPVQFEVEVTRSSWVALRVYPGAHTNPIFVLVGSKPIRAHRRSVEWCLKSVEQCWSQKERFYSEKEKADAKAAYDHARKVYRQRLEESEAD